MRNLAWGAGLLLAAVPAFAAPDDKPDDKSPADQVKAVVADYQKAEQDFYDKLRAAQTPEEQEKLADKRPKPEPVAARLLELAEKNPKDPGVMPEALVQVVTLRFQSAEGMKLRDKALDLLTRGYADSDKVGPPLLSRLIYTPSPAGEHFLRAVLEKNPSRDLKGMAAFCLGSLLKEAGDIARMMKSDPELAKRVEEFLGKDAADWLSGGDAGRLEKDAEAAFEQAADKYADVKFREGSDDTIGEEAKAALFEIRELAIGKVAPELEGEDLDGKPFKLSDYRGKVVVLDFWGNW